MESTIRVLNEMKEAGVVDEYAIGRAIAALFYIEPFETHDLDVFISLPVRKGKILRVDPVYEYLLGRGYDSSGGEILVEGVPVQFLVAGTLLGDEAIREANTLTYGDQAVRVMTPEHLLAMMAELGRPKDRIRVTTVSRASGFQPGAVGRHIEATQSHSSMESNRGDGWRRASILTKSG